MGTMGVSGSATGEPGGMSQAGARTRARWVARTRAELASSEVMQRLARRVEQQLPERPGLVQKLQLAALDEARHAAQCTEVLQALREPAPTTEGLPTLPEAESEDPAVSLLENAVFLLCAGEAIAAAMLEEARREATQPLVVQILAQIAEDEARHASLGWAVIDGLLPNLTPEARVEASSLARKQAIRAVVAAARVGSVDDDAAEWGVLSSERALEVAKGVLKTVVGPGLHARGLWA